MFHPHPKTDFIQHQSLESTCFVQRRQPRHFPLNHQGAEPRSCPSKGWCFVSKKIPNWWKIPTGFCWWIFFFGDGDDGFFWLWGGDQKAKNKIKMFFHVFCLVWQMFLDWIFFCQTSSFGRVYCRKHGKHLHQVAFWFPKWRSLKSFSRSFMGPNKVTLKNLVLQLPLNSTKCRLKIFNGYHLAECSGKTPMWDSRFLKDGQSFRDSVGI